MDVCPQWTAAAYDALARLNHLGQPYILANFKQAGIPLPAGIRTDDDGFAQAPEDVRRVHSLHFIGRDDVPAWIELFEELRGRTGVIVVFTKHARNELFSGLKLYLAWYSKPLTLKMAFEHGSEHLFKGLTTGVEAILLETSPAEGSWLYVRPESEVALEQFQEC